MAALNHSLGFQCEFIDSVPEDFYCKSCNFVARKFTITSCCGESYCHACIAGNKEQGKPCLACGEKVFNLVKHMKYQKKIDKLQVYCSMKKRGCVWSGPLEQLDTHLDPDQDNCQYVDTKCPLNCDMAIPKNEVEQHVANLCVKRPYICQHCNFKATYEEVVDKHLLECMYVPLQCPNFCGVTFERNFIKDHMKMCRLEKIRCKFRDVGCNDQFSREDQEKHAKDSSQKHITLTASVTMEIRQELQDQVKKYKQIVQNLKQKLQEQEQNLRKKLEEQELNVMQKLEEREQNMKQKLEEQKQRFTQELEKLHSLNQKLDVQEQTFEWRLGQKMKEQEQKMKEQEQKMKEQEQKMKEQEQKMKEQEQKMKEHEKKMKEQEQKMKEQEQKMKEQKQKMMQQEQKISEQEKTLIHLSQILKQWSDNTKAKLFSLLPRICTMNNFNQKKEKGTLWCSPGMYTHIGGYKFHIVVNIVECVNVFDWGGHNKTIAVHLHSSPGAFDNQLKWPVKAKFTLELVNLHGNDNAAHEVSPTWDKPVETACVHTFNRFNSGGSSYFIDHSQLSNYLDNDKLHFHVSKVLILN